MDCDAAAAAAERTTVSARASQEPAELTRCANTTTPFGAQHNAVFAPFGASRAEVVRRKGARRSCGFGCVSFNDRADLEAATARMHGARVGGRAIYVGPWAPREEAGAAQRGVRGGGYGSGGGYGGSGSGSGSGGGGGREHHGRERSRSRQRGGRERSRSRDRGRRERGGGYERSHSRERGGRDGGGGGSRSGGFGPQRGSSARPHYAWPER